MNLATHQRTRLPRRHGAITIQGLAIVVVLLLFTVLTNQWAGWQQAVDDLNAGDFVSYEAMAKAAPSFPSEEIDSAYSQRFASHYLIGTASELSGLDLHTTYWIAGAACLGALLLVMLALLAQLSLSPFALALVLALFILNPFSLRPYMIFPGGVQDLVFVLGLAVVMLGLTRRRYRVVLLGAVLAILGRQTALLVAPAAAVWIVWGEGWRSRSVRERVLGGAGIVALTVGLYYAVVAVTQSFTHRFQPEFPDDTILALLPDQLSSLASHFARVGDPLIVPVGALVAALLAIGLSRLGKLPFEVWASLLIAAAIVIQPIVISPDFPGLAHNEQRLSVMGLLPLLVALAFVLERLEGSRPPPWGARAALMFGLLAVASLHNVFTTIGPESDAQFVLVQVIATAGIAWALLGLYSSRVGSAETH